MRREFAFALVAFLAAALAAAQQAAAPNATAPSANTTSRPYQVGGRISAPVLTHSVMAKFTDEARRAHYQGVCIVALIVDAKGRPQNVHIVRSLGMGLDEKAMDAIRKYKFKPALMDGKTPVPVMVTVEVNFHLYSR